jgi:hypothetical protein
MRLVFFTAVALVLCAATLLSETLFTSRKTNALREGAGSYYGLVGSVPENTQLIVMARSGPWMKVQLPNKKVGWISSNSVKSDRSAPVAAKWQETLWSSPKALSAAIKGFGQQYVPSAPGAVDSVLRSAEKGFTSEDLATFAKEVRQNSSRNRDRVEVDDLGLPAPEYYTDLPEQQIGVSVAARIATKGLVNDRQLLRYVNLVCATVAETSPVYDAELTVLILNDGAINAFAAPGGYIFVTRGLLAQCKDESELAGVIAHEIAHVYRRHGLEELSKRIAGIHADAAFLELEEETGDPTDVEREMDTLADQTYEKIVHPRLLSYEIEADKIGAVVAANAGYDPFGLVRISERVARASAEAPTTLDPNYMAPDDAAKRARDIRTFAEKTFVAESPGERMSGRFTSATSAVR